MDARLNDDILTCGTHGAYDPFDTGECPGCISDRIARDAVAGDRHYLINVYGDAGDESYGRMFAVVADDVPAARVKALRYLGAWEEIDGIELVDREFAEYVGVEDGA